MNNCTTKSVSVFSCTSEPSSKYFNNWFNGNTTNFGSKALQPNYDPKLINKTINSSSLIRPM